MTTFSIVNRETVSPDPNSKYWIDMSKKWYLYFFFNPEEYYLNISNTTIGTLDAYRKAISWKTQSPVNQLQGFVFSYSNGCTKLSQIYHP